MIEYPEKALLYSAAVESSDDAILTKTLDGIITSWNPAAEKLYGYTEKEAIGKNIDIIVPEEMRGEVRSILERLRTGGRIDHHETVRVSKNGSPIHVSLTVSPVKSSAGVIIGASAIARDITERVRIEKYISQNRESFPVLFDTVPDIVWAVDAQGNYADVAGQNIRQREKSFRKTVHPDDRRNVEFFFRQIVDSQRSAEIEFRFLSENGEWRWASLIGVPLTDKKGAVGGWLGVKLDVTRQKKMVSLTMMEFNKSSEQLRHLAMRINSSIEQERRRIAIEVHDQLGGNLVEIKHNLESIIKAVRERNDHEQNSETLKKLDDTCKLTLKTIGTVKKISAELHPAELDYLGLVAAVRSEAENFSKRFGISYDFDSEIEDTSLGKEQELAVFRVFQELLRNVLRHAGASKLKINLAENKKEFSLTVEDNGRGITEKEQRAEKSLGLLGIKERIRHVGGSFTIKGIEGLGTTAVVVIPLKTL